jgi:hypothetical protein
MRKKITTKRQLKKGGEVPIDLREDYKALVRKNFVDPYQGVDLNKLKRLVDKSKLASLPLAGFNTIYPKVFLEMLIALIKTTKQAKKSLSIEDYRVIFQELLKKFTDVKFQVTEIFISNFLKELRRTQNEFNIPSGDRVGGSRRTKRLKGLKNDIEDIAVENDPNKNEMLWYDNAINYAVSKQKDFSDNYKKLLDKIESGTTINEKLIKDLASQLPKVPDLPKGKKMPKLPELPVKEEKGLLDDVFTWKTAGKVAKTVGTIALPLLLTGLLGTKQGKQLTSSAQKMLQSGVDKILPETDDEEFLIESDEIRYGDIYKNKNKFIVDVNEPMEYLYDDSYISPLYDTKELANEIISDYDDYVKQNKYINNLIEKGIEVKDNIYQSAQQAFYKTLDKINNYDEELDKIARYVTPSGRSKQRIEKLVDEFTIEREKQSEKELDKLIDEEISKLIPKYDYYEREPEELGDFYEVFDEQTIEKLIEDDIKKQEISKISEKQLERLERNRLANIEKEAAKQYEKERKAYLEKEQEKLLKELDISRQRLTTKINKPFRTRLPVKDVIEGEVINNIDPEVVRDEIQLNFPNKTAEVINEKTTDAISTISKEVAKEVVQENKPYGRRPKELAKDRPRGPKGQFKKKGEGYKRKYVKKIKK